MNTDSLSVAPVRHPVVQISSELHATMLTEGEKNERAEKSSNLREAPVKRNQRRRETAEMNVSLHDGTTDRFRTLSRSGADPRLDLYTRETSRFEMKTI